MEPIILPHGGYQKLESYQNSIIIFDATNDFCARFLKKGDRTVDQMIQAARSGKQNIVEGCEASGISAETEIKLLGVARASLEELLEDYRDYLRTHALPLWKKDDKRVLVIRRLAKLKDRSYRTYKSYFEGAGNGAEVFCNTMISLIHQTNYLLDRQIRSLEQSFTQKGGLRER
ncbi:MAG: four helix bundle suffix domain-containing protein, partial [Lentisphaeria bacterium]|nr:four helix bundle suffix domain-containing protein [Lentisphaeria bacterium]